MAFVCKFGGTSLATPASFKKVVEIIQSDSRRRIVVPSAPGKESASDLKVTDALLRLYGQKRQRMNLGANWGWITGRFVMLAEGVGLKDFLNEALAAVGTRLQELGKDHLASRGEYWNGLLLAKLLGFEFVDAADVIRFLPDGKLDPVSYSLIAGRCRGSVGYVIPGFYGLDHEGDICCFSRGGSDITGAIVAAGVGAEVYENWTDIDGLCSADPRIVANPAAVRNITYRELRELAYSGATVFHDEAVSPARRLGIPIHILNTFNPQCPGTVISATRESGEEVVVGIAAKTGFIVFNILIDGTHNNRGVIARLAKIFDDLGVSIEHMPTGIDTLSVIVMDKSLNGQRGEVERRLRDELQPDELTVTNNLALIATVGQGMVRHVGTSARLFQALAKASVNVSLIGQGSSENNIIVGVNADQLEQATRAIYTEFFGQ